MAPASVYMHSPLSSDGSVEEALKDLRFADAFTGDDGETHAEGFSLVGHPEDGEAGEYMGPSDDGTVEENGEDVFVAEEPASIFVDTGAVADSIVGRLRAERDMLHERLMEASEVNAELMRCKQALSDEVVDLSKSLFEEANAMVAEERRARAEADAALSSARRELEDLRDVLAVERAQLGELRGRMHSASVSGPVSPVSREDGAMGDIRDSASLSVRYAASLPDESGAAPFAQFDSRRTFGPQWEAVGASIDAAAFAAFCAFAQAADVRRGENAGAAGGSASLSSSPGSPRPLGGSSATEDVHWLLAQPYVRTVHEQDVLPLLRTFVHVPRNYHAQLVRALLANTATVERVPAMCAHSLPAGTPSRRALSPQSDAPSDIESDCAGASFTGREDGKVSDGGDERAFGKGETKAADKVSERDNGGTIDHREIASDDGKDMDSPCSAASSFSEARSDGAASALSSQRASPLRSPNSAPTAAQGTQARISDFFKRTLASLSTTGGRAVFSLPEAAGRACGLCGGALDTLDLHGEPPYRMRLRDADAWIEVDACCRQRLVALGQYYTFLRHLVRGLHARRPLIDLYYDSLALRRLLFYARVGTGATAFFRQHDWEAHLGILDTLRLA